MTGVRRRAFFLDAQGGGRFCTLLEPTTAARGNLLLVPPFAEELNKSRRMLALAATVFARSGWRVLHIDLLGTGDSAGEFRDASWIAWLDDLSCGRDFLQHGADLPLVLWSLRAGSLLCAQWQAREGTALPWLAWQAVAQGRQHVQQFLRLKGVSEMLNDADAKAVMSSLRAEIAAGAVVEVAGYELAPQLLGGLECAVLEQPPAATLLLEVGSGDGGLSPGLQRLLERWRDGGAAVDAGSVPGSVFWQTQEIETAPALIDASLPWLAARGA